MRKEVIGNATLYLGDCIEILPTLPKVDAVITDPPYGLGIEYASFVDTPENVKALADKWLPLARAIAPCVAFTPGIGADRFYPNPDHICAWIMTAGGYRASWGFGMWQPILCYGKDPYLAKGLGARPDTIITNGTDKIKENHPCPKPDFVWQRIVNRFSLEGQTVVDPFMGSGTGGAVCHKIGRKFIGIEIEPKYFDIACERIENAQRQERLFA